MKNISFKNIIRLESTGSTNEYIKEEVEELPAGTVVFTRSQDRGRGRFDRKWFAEKDKSIIASFLIKGIYDNNDAIRLSFLFSIAVKLFLIKYVDSDNVLLKWPNDVLINNRKICGILSDYSAENVIIGTGININTFVPGEEIERPWTALQNESGEEYSIREMENEFIECVNAVFQRYCTNSLDEIPAIWFRESGTVNKNVTVVQNEMSIKGKIKAIDDNGVLIIKKDNGSKINITNGDIIYND